MPFVDVEGGALYHEVHGRGEPIVFAHGAGGNHLSWWQQVPYFRDRYTCVTFDHRGYGRSGTDVDPAAGRHFVNDLAVLIDRLGFDRVNLVAQSMGGWTCLGYARAHPERVRRLVMASTPGGIRSPEIDAIYARALAAAPPPAGSAPPGSGERLARDQPALAFLWDQIGALSPARDRPTIRAMLREIHSATADDLAGFQIPTLFIVGEEDAAIPPDVIVAASRLVPKAELARVPEAGHSIYFQYPDRFNRLVETFLNQAS